MNKTLFESMSTLTQNLLLKTNSYHVQANKMLNIKIRVSKVITLRIDNMIQMQPILIIII